MAKLPLAEWQVEHVRLTAFPLPDANARSSEWWQQVTDTQPDEATMNPKKGSALIQGAFGPGKLILKLEPERVDWVFAPPETDVEELGATHTFPNLGPASEMIEAFSVVAERWLARADLPAIVRMAFGAVLMHQETDRQAGYLRLPDYVPVGVDPESTDFLYQINLPSPWTSIGSEGLRLNRLSKWSVSGFRLISFNVTGSAVQSRPVPAVFALRVELDINTSPTYAEAIPEARLGEVYRELVAAGLAIATNGVRPQ